MGIQDLLTARAIALCTSARFGHGLSSRQLAGARFFCHSSENTPGAAWQTRIVTPAHHPSPPPPPTTPAHHPPPVIPAKAGTQTGTAGVPARILAPRQRPPPFSSSMVSVATGMANCSGPFHCPENRMPVIPAQAGIQVGGGARPSCVSQLWKGPANCYENRSMSQATKLPRTDGL